MALSEEKLCSVGCKWMYTFNCLEAKKFIPVNTSTASVPTSVSEAEIVASVER